MISIESRWRDLDEATHQSLEVLGLHRLGYADHGGGGCGQAAAMWNSTPSTTSVGYDRDDNLADREGGPSRGPPQAGCRSMLVFVWGDRSEGMCWVGGAGGLLVEAELEVS
jgi:hypothetical protein